MGRQRPRKMSGVLKKKLQHTVPGSNWRMQMDSLGRPVIGSGSFRIRQNPIGGSLKARIIARRGPSIPALYPGLMGKAASRYQRVTTRLENVSIRKVSRKQGTGRAGGGGELLGKGGHKTGTARARKAARAGGTRGGIPLREAKKKPKA